METNLKAVKTADGSSTLFNERYGDHYHSLHGAETESKYVFIEKGLKFLAEKTDEVKLLEIGLGTGLNALLTHQHYKLLKIKELQYTSLEPFPIQFDVALELTFDVLNTDGEKDFFKQLHCSPWENCIQITDDFYFSKSRKRLQKFTHESIFNLVYYDAFGPAYQPEMWNMQAVEKVFSLMASDSVLVTYCAQGQFRRNLLACGFIVERLKGPPGKREMIRALKY